MEKCNYINTHTRELGYTHMYSVIWDLSEQENHDCFTEAKHVTSCL